MWVPERPEVVVGFPYELPKMDIENWGPLKEQQERQQALQPRGPPFLPTPKFDKLRKQIYKVC